MTPNISIVTAFFDIGRGSWQGPDYIQRKTEQYMLYFERLLKLQNDIVVFTSADLIEPIRELGRKHNHQNLTIIAEDLQSIYPKYRDTIQHVLIDPNYQMLVQTP